MKKELFVLTNPTMCLFPWTHMYIHTTGDVYPCCIATPGNTDNSLGNIKSQTIEEIWNGELYKNLRRDMVEGTYVPHCKQCHLRENTEGRNYRHGSFDMFGKHIDSIVQNTNVDYSVKETDIKYLDIRFSNVCNFKCRYCSEEYSTTWAVENRKRNINKHLPNYLHVSDENPLFMKQIQEHLNNLEHVYFAGGEPLLTSEHYEMLESLIDKDKRDVQLRYSSNCSTVRFKNYDVTDLWKNFSSVDFRASLDSFGARAAYMRHGTNWETVVSNILYIKENSPNVKISINCVVSVYNILTITEFLQELHDVGVLSWLNTTVVLYPIASDFFLDANVLPPSLKKHAREKIEKFILTLPVKTKVIHDLNIIKNYLNEDDVDVEYWKQFKLFNEDLDRVRSEKLSDVFPELATWYNNILI